MWSMILPNHLRKNCLRLVIRCLSRQSDTTITVEKGTHHSIISLWENVFHYIWFSKQKLVLIFTSLNRETITAFNSQKKINQFFELWQMRWNTKISQTISFRTELFLLLLFHLNKETQIVRLIALTRSADLNISLLIDLFCIYAGDGVVVLCIWLLSQTSEGSIPSPGTVDVR